MKKFNRNLSILYFVLGAISIVYDIILLVLTPGTILDNLTSFTNIWALLGFLLIFFGIFRLKTGHSIWQNLKKWMKITVISVVSFGGIVAIICLIFIFNPKVVSKSEKGFSPDYMIVLGGGIDKNGKLPKNVIRRIDVAADFLREHPETVCVVTGGQLDWLPYAEAPEMKRQLENRGIESGRIIAEAQAQDTIQNFKYSCKMLADYAGVGQEEILKSNIVVVTSYFHLRRAERLAARMGFENVYGIGAKCTPITALHIYVREIAAYVKLNLRILFTGQPEPICLNL